MAPTQSRRAPARRARLRRTRTDPPPMGHASCLLLPRCRSAPIATSNAITESASATIVSVSVPPPPSELFASIVGAGASDDSGAGPVDDRAVGVRLLHLERVRAGRGRLREELEQRILTRRGVSARPRHLLDDGVVSRTRSAAAAASSRRRRDERVDPEPLGHGQDDLRRRQVLLLGRDGQAVQLQLLRERNRRADARVREGRRGEHERRSGDNTQAPGPGSQIPHVDVSSSAYGSRRREARSAARSANEEGTEEPGRLRPARVGPAAAAARSRPASS